MKKFRILIFALAFVLALSVTAFATETETEQRDVSFENSLAADLKALGLFSGVSDTNFDLERVPTRLEVLVMLIRVLGEEKAALEGEWEHPFTDVPAWADKYVGYAYENELTKGVSDTKFGTDNASSATYLTFMLRALGYSDAKGDFAWDAPHTLADGLGLLPSIVDTENFWRADIVTVSYAALSVNIKNTPQTLAEKLIEKGAFAAETYGANYTGTKLTDKENESKAAFTAEQVYSESSPAVFYIETFDEEGELYWSGSGFFIDESGIAVSTFMVLEGAASAEITIPGSGAKYKVSGIYDASYDYDWCVFQVDGSGFTALDTNSLPVKGASNVYTISSPEGLQNTVAQGIVSNVRRVLYEDYTYIQTTAPVSEGSDGGALINDYGEAIGIITEIYYGGQNLNFAIPISYIAIADTSVLTPFEEYNWNIVTYTVDTYDVTVKAGETVTYHCEYDYYTVSGDSPTFKIESSDYAVAGAMQAISQGDILITGQKAGQTTVVISDDLSDDTLVINVTVEENPDLAAHVNYIPYFDEVKLSVGAKKTNLVAICEVGLSGAPDGSLAASYTVKSSNSAIKVTSRMDEEDPCYLIFDVTASKKATGEITVTNDMTGDTLVVPVTVGDNYAAAFDQLKNFIIAEGEYNEDTEEPSDSCYDYYIGDDSLAIGIAYYPESDVVYWYYVYGYSLYVDITLTADGTAKFHIAMPEYEIYGDGDITPKTFGSSTRGVSFSEYEGSSSLKSEFAEVTTSSLVGLLYMVDYGIMYMDIPGMSISDFGFVGVNYELFGIEELPIY